MPGFGFDRNGNSYRINENGDISGGGSLYSNRGVSGGGGMGFVGGNGDVNLNLNLNSNSTMAMAMNGKSYSDGDTCDCCPYGYHIDRDFVGFSKNMLAGEGNVQRIQEVKEKLRSERQSMDKLLGLSSRKNNTSQADEVGTISRATVDIWRTLHLDTAFNFDMSSPRETDLDGRTSAGSDYLYGNGLDEAVTDFEEALLRSRPQDRGLSYEIPDSQKFHTFPRLKGPIVRDIETSPTTLTMKKGTSNSRSVMPDGTMFSSWTSRKEEWNSPLPTPPKTPTGPRPAVPPRRRNFEDERIAQLEEQVKLIPKLEEKLAAMEEEKKQLMKKVESEMGIREKNKSILNDIFKEAEELNNNNVIPRSADFQSVPYRRPARSSEVKYPPLRTIGVGNSSEPTHMWEIGRSEDTPSPGGTKSPSGTLRRRIRTFDTGVQVNECELDESKSFIPVLQIIEKVDFGAQVTLDPPAAPAPSVQSELEPVKKPSVKNIGISAKPKTSDIGLMQKPDQREVKCNTTDVRTKHVGVTASMDVAKTVEIPVPPITVEPEPKEVRSIASNTDKLKSRTVSLSTDELKSFSTNSTQTIPVEEKVQVQDTPEEKLEKKPSLTLPVVSSSKFDSIGEAIKGLSKIPRFASPTSPSSSKLFTKPSSQPPAEPSPTEESSASQKPPYKRSNTYTKEVEEDEAEDGFEDRGEERVPTPSRLDFVRTHSPIPERREKVKPSKEMQGALKVLNDALLRGRTTQQVTNAISIILHEWFRVAGTKTAHPLDVEDYLDMFENYSPQLLRYIVNMPDGSGNTAMHYAVSHGNFDVVSILLDSKVCDPNKANKAGYTSVMLVSLAKVLSETHRQVVRRLFSTGDVNIKAAQHGQTALMLAASHGRLDTVKLLLESGADMNIQDEDGSTALMCASEHGHGEIVRFFLEQPECDPRLADNDGSTALSVAMEAGHKDIGVMIYAQMHFVDSAASTPGASPASRKKKIPKRIGGQTPPSSPGSSSQPSPATTKKHY